MATSAPVPMAMPRSAWARAPGVVDAVADHGDDRALAAAVRRTLAAFSAGSTSARTWSMPTWAATACGGRAVVAGQHPDLEPERLELGDGLGGLRLHGVGDGDHAGRLVVDRDVHRRLA